MKNNKFYITLLIIILLSAFFIYKMSKQPKVAVIDFNLIVMEFDGMKEAMKSYEAKAKVWEKEMDSLQKNMNAVVLDLESNEYSKEEIFKKESLLIKMRNAYTKYKTHISNKAQEEDNKLTTSVISQVTEFIEAYGSKNGYDIIYGKNEGNYILYKSNEFDITDKVLAELNNDYSGE